MGPAITKTLFSMASAGLLIVAVHCSAQSGIVSSTPSDVQTNTESVPLNPPLSASLSPGSSDASNSSSPLMNRNSNINTATPQIGSGAHLMNVTLGLMFIIVLIFGISWFVKRFGQGTFSGTTNIRVLSSFPLGTRERLVLIDAGGQQLLLGITPTQINTLHVFETPVIADTAENHNSEFSRKLIAILQRNSHESGEANSKKNSGAPE